MCPSMPAPAPAAFSFGTPAVAASTAPAPVAAAPVTVAGGDDDEGEPILEPEMALRNEDDKDEILYETDCRLKRLDTKAEPKPEWKDVGKGALRVTKDPDTGKKRILIREKVMGKVTLNVSFFPAQKFEKRGKHSVQFPALVADPDPEAAPGATSLQTFVIRTREGDIDAAIAALLSARG